MKLKRILASILCIAMVLSTMGTVVFAEDGNTLYVDPASIEEGFYTNLAAAAADAQDGDIIVLAAGEYDITGANFGTVTVKAADDAAVTIDVPDHTPTADLPHQDYNANVTFENVTLDFYPNGNYNGLQYNTVICNGCTINGQMFLYALTSDTFNNCIFNQNDSNSYNVWTYTSKHATFNDCTFNCAGKGLLVYNEGAVSTVNVVDTDFIASEAVDGKAAIEISAYGGAAFVTVDNETTADGFATGNNSENTLWNVKDATTLNDTVVEVADEFVHIKKKNSDDPVVAMVEGESGTNLYTSIADAIAAIADNSTVVIYEGEYDAALEITENNVTVKAYGEVLFTQTPKFKGTNYYVEGIDFEYASGGNILNCSGTLKNCTFTSDGNTVRGAYGTKDGNLVIDGCTFTTGNPQSNWALHFDQTYGADITIKGSKINGRLAIGGDVNSMSVEGTSITGGYANTWGANEKVTYTNCVFDVGYIYTGDDDASVDFSACTTEDGTSIKELLYDKEAFVTVDGKVVTREAKLGDTYYKTLADALAMASSGDIIELTDGTFYLVPQVAGDNQATVTFDFGGGVNADGFISETFILNLGESINAPTGLVKNGYIFKGWDKNVPEKAYASETYIAQWILKDDYKFKTVLTPVGGIEVAENEIKIDPQGSFIVEVSIEDAIDDMAWNVTEVTLSYNKDLFAWNKLNNTVTEDSEGNLVFKVYGEDKVDGKVAKQLSFTAKENTDKTKTYEGEFNVVKASVDTGWAANTIDATLVDDENKGTAKVYIYYTFDVTVGDGVVAPSTADTITDYEGEIKEYNPEYNYDIIVDMDGKGEFNVDYNETTGEFTIDNADIVGDFTIDAVRTGIKGVTTDDVEIYEYVAGKYALVLLNADSARTYAYNGALMYKTPQYDTVAGKKVHFGYLVKETAFEIDSTGSLNTEANKALALSKITLASGTNPSIDKIEIVGDANGTGIVDVNDIQAVWNCYNVESNDGAGVNVNMPLYLRADICGANAAGRDKKVDVADLNAVIAMYDYTSEGGTVEYVPTVFATCETDGTTYSIVCGETIIVAATPISAVAHNYVWTGIEGEGADVVSVETCTKCDDEMETKITDIIPDVKLNGDKIYGIVNIDSADDLIYINRLDAAGKLSHGEGRQPVININADIDLAGYEWRALNGHFVTINGNGNTISNINGVEGNSGKGGFIGYGGGCQINNLTLENISVEGCQVGAFFGGGEGGSVVDCTLKGNVNITWKQNYTSDYVEEYGAIGIISGLHAGGGEYKVTIDADTNIVIDDSAFTSTKITEVGYTRTDNDYIQYVQGSTLVTNITDLRSNN